MGHVGRIQIKKNYPLAIGFRNPSPFRGEGDFQRERGAASGRNSGEGEFNNRKFFHLYDYAIITPVKNKISTLNKLIIEKSPLVHNITNYVAANDCANVTLAIGASPIMADDILEVEEITSKSSALVLNIGTLNQNTVKAMILAAKKANELNIPVIFDPVGASVSQFRRETVERILGEVKISIIKGNLSEIAYISGMNIEAKGVDSATGNNEIDVLEIANKVSNKYKCTVVITGEIDVISDGKRSAKIHNGNPSMQKVTGTGCMISSIIGAYASVCDDFFTSTVAGILMMGIAGDIAYETFNKKGSGSYRNAIIDAISKIDGITITNEAKISN